MSLESSQLRLLSNKYRELNAELHVREPTYGTTGRKYVDEVRRLARRFRARSILDYGCGKKDLWKALHSEFDIRNFDPAIPGLDIQPEPADFVACIDVLEHVEPEYLTIVLADLQRLTLRGGFFTIATRPAQKQLADGTNPHRIIEGSEWWRVQLTRYFEIESVTSLFPDNGLQVIATPTVRICL